MNRIRCQDDVDSALQLLLQGDARLRVIAQTVPHVPLRLRSSGFAGLAHIVIAQLLSVASAKAISARLDTLLPQLDSASYLAADKEAVRGCGLTRAKYQTLLSVARAEQAGEFDFNYLEQLEVTDAQRMLCQFKGIGPWTAEVYLMFCAGFSDIFPAGDLALRKACESALSLPERPSSTQLAKLAQQWSPHRATAARLLWAYYAVMTQREGLI